MFDFKKGLRTAQPAAQIASTTMEEVAAAIGATGVRFAHHNASGNDYLQLVLPDDTYLPVKISPKCRQTASDVEGRILEVVENNVVFYGENAVEVGGVATGEKRIWFTIAPKGTLVPNTVYSLADLIKGKNITTSLA